MKEMNCSEVLMRFNLSREQFYALEKEFLEMKESRDDWKKNWQLEQAMNKKLEERVKELEGKLSEYKEDHLTCCYDHKQELLKRAEQAETSLTRLLDAVEKLKPLVIRTHYYREDCWYTCPKHPEGCCNEAVGPDCNCGADEHNREVEAFYQVAEEIKKGGKDEI